MQDLQVGIDLASLEANANEPPESEESNVARRSHPVIAALAPGANVNMEALEHLRYFSPPTQRPLAAV